MARVRDYSKGLIYKIECNDPSITECYYGSTINFRNRKNQHKTDCCNDKGKAYNRKVYKFIRDNGGWDNWCMVLVEYYPCKTKLELERHERTFVINNVGGLNKNSPALSIEEKKEYGKHYHEANKDKIRECNKHYREANKEKIKDRKKRHYEANKDKIREYREANKDKMREYREANKDKMREYKKKYRKANKEKIKENDKQYREANKEKIRERHKQYREANKNNSDA